VFLAYLAAIVGVEAGWQLDVLISRRPHGSGI
jgi:hypothetical protein